MIRLQSMHLRKLSDKFVKCEMSINVRLFFYKENGSLQYLSKKEITRSQFPHNRHEVGNKDAGYVLRVHS